MIGKSGLILIILTSTALALPPDKLPVKPTIATTYEEALAFLDSNRPDAALERLELLVKNAKAHAQVTMGPAFGNILYHYGEALAATGQPERAMNAWKTCYLDFPNPPPPAEQENRHLLFALLRWAETSYETGNYKNALKLYLKALKAHGKEIDRSNILLNLAACLQKTGRQGRAEKIYRNILASSQEGQYDPAHFRAFVEQALLFVEKGAFDDARSLLLQHPRIFNTPVSNRHNASPLLLRIARRCLFAEHSMMALRWLHGIPSPYEVAMDKTAQSLLGKAIVEPSNVDDGHMMKEILLARAYAYYQLGAYRLALAGYQWLAGNSHDEKLPEILHAACTSAAFLQEPDRAKIFLSRLSEQFNSYPRLPEAVTSWVEALMRSKRYSEVLTEALSFRETIEPGKLAREGLDFSVASAYYQLEKFRDASKAFRAFTQEFPLSPHRQTAAYHEAVCHVHMRQWATASTFLDAMDSANRDFSDGILYYLAVCSNELDDPAKAMDKIDQLLDEHPNSTHIPKSLNLAGDIHFASNTWEDSLHAYTKAEEKALHQGGQPDVAAYAAHQAILIAHVRKQWDQVLEQYIHFQQDHGHSSIMARASMLAASALASRGEGEEAIALLVGCILDRARTLGDPDLPDLLDQHHALYKRMHGYEKLTQHLRDFPGPHPHPKSLKMWLFIGELEALESISVETHAKKIYALYHEIPQTFSTHELPDFFLLKLARWLLDTGEPESAVSYYRELIDLREDASLQQIAHLELGRHLGQNADGDSQTEALALLRKVESETRDPVLEESSVVEIARIYMRQKAWGQGAKWWKKVLDHSSWVSARAEAHYQLGACKDRLARTDEALALYLGTYIHFEENIEWSSRAFLRTALIYRERGDQGKARRVLTDMMERLGHHSHPIVDKARTLHHRWQVGKEEDKK